MILSFGEAAAKLAGQVALLLGWPPAQFWAATPHELEIILSAAAPPPAGMSRAALDMLMEQDRDQ